MTTPDVTPVQYTAIGTAAIGLIAQLTDLPPEAKDNLTTICTVVVGFLISGDTIVRVGRQKWVAGLMADRDKDGVPDMLENMPLAWLLAIVFGGLTVALTVALLLVIFL